MSNSDSRATNRDERDHLDEVDDGLGCVEVWEELSEYREEE